MVKKQARTTNERAGAVDVNGGRLWVCAMLVVMCLMVATFRSTTATRQLTALMKLDTVVFDQMIKEGANAFYSTQQQHHSVAGEPSAFQYTEYKPAPVERYLVENAEALQLNQKPPKLVPTCQLWKDPQSTPYYTQLHHFLSDLDDFYAKVATFELPLRDLRQNITTTNNNHDVCELVKLHPDGLAGMFNKSGQLSYTSSGFAEPLLPPMRHPRFCLEGRAHLFTMQYMVHDFYALCQKLKPTSRTIFIDMGASMSFHPNMKSPVLFLLDLYKQFGFQFDHIYGYEMRQHDPNQVFNQIPASYQAAYHWINVGVDSDQNSLRNPFKLILDNYNEDDLIIVKLDVDTPQLERDLAEQLLQNPQLANLIDHFYFEHHVNQQELAPFWGRAGVVETVHDSMKLFHELRKKGIPAHFWV